MDAEVVGIKGVIPGLYAAGEIAGGVHGINRVAVAVVVAVSGAGALLFRD